MLVGLAINPIAGMGGPVGLKGTDGIGTLREARRRGATECAGQRTLEALEGVELADIKFLTAGGTMGEDVLAKLRADYRVVHTAGEPTGPDDTKLACRRMFENGADVIVFTGGDGTARDVMDAVDQLVPVIGIPSGVKMHSGVFANDPASAGRLLMEFSKGGLPVRPAEVMDIDEEAFREGRLSASLYGYLSTPYKPGLVQASKGVYTGEGIESEKEEIGLFLADTVKEGICYILGPGTTVAAVATAMEVEKTLLGVDLVSNGRTVLKDASAAELLSYLDRCREARIIVTPIGAQGFIFGRGNQQISAEVIRKVGRENILIIATPTKLSATKVLRVDTGDRTLDEELRGHLRVLYSFGRYRMVRVV